MPLSGFQHAGRIVDGKLKLESPRAFRTSIWRMKPGPVVVSVEVKKSKRTLDQNAWVWAVAYPIIAETLGYDRHEHADLHYALVAKCFGTHHDPALGMEIPNKRSSNLTTKEFSEYMEWLVRFAAQEFNCQLPLPDERIAG